MIPLVCKRCGFDILYYPQWCIAGVVGHLKCEAETLWIGFRFSDNLADERHRFYLELKAAHFHAAEVGDSVLAQTEDVVAIDDIFKRTVDHSRGIVRATTRRFTDSELQEFEDKYKDVKPGRPHDPASGERD